MTFGVTFVDMSQDAKIPKACMELLEFLAGQPERSALEENVPPQLRREQVVAVCESKAWIRQSRWVESTMWGETTYDTGNWFELTDEGFALVSEHQLLSEDSKDSGGNHVLTREEQALGLLAASPKITKKEIATQLGIHPSAVSRMKRLAEAMRASKQSSPVIRGSKDKKTGKVEAVRDDSDDE